MRSCVCECEQVKQGPEPCVWFREVLCTQASSTSTNQPCIAANQATISLHAHSPAAPNPARKIKVPSLSTKHTAVPPCVCVLCTCACMHACVCVLEGMNA